MAAVRPVASSAMAGTHGICVWMTGAPRAGKSTIARLVVEQRQAAGHSVVLIDGAEVREYLPMGPRRRPCRGSRLRRGVRGYAR